MIPVKVHGAEDQQGGMQASAGMMRRMVWRRLKALEDGCLVLVEGGLRRTFGDTGDRSLCATVEVCDPRFYRRLAFGGSLGAAEA